MYNNLLTTFETTLSNTHMSFHYLSSSFSFYCFCPIIKGEKWLSPKLFNINCTNITPLTKTIHLTMKINYTLKTIHDTPPTHVLSMTK